MANYNFKIPFTAPAEDLIGRVRAAITHAKGTLHGDTAAGKFKIPVGIGDIEGNYSVAGSVISIDITKKPMLVSRAMIENRLKGYLDRSKE